jgi:integrase
LDILGLPPCIHVGTSALDILGTGVDSMARKVRDKELDTREARGKLRPRGKPYWRTIERGLHLGYRRLKGKAGTWWARHYLGDQQYETESVGVADDLSDADGVAILSYWHAQQKARERMVKRAHSAAGKTGPLMVKDAVEHYLEWLETNRKSAYDARRRAEAFIFPKLGGIECESLNADVLRKWHATLAKQPPRVRTRKGEKQKYRELADDDESRRRRRASANRTLTILKAGLNRAWREGKVSSDTAWRRVEPFENVDAARIRYLTVAEAKRLINASGPEFRPLVQAALQTGARYGELIRLQCHDFNPDAGTLAIRQSKSGKARHVVLTDEGMALFRQLTAGRSGHELLLRNEGRMGRALERERERLKNSGKPLDGASVNDEGEWRASEQGRPMREACSRAKIAPAISFHALRHTWASLAVMNGVPLLVVAKNLGHADTRMVEKHYGHLASSYIADAIRAGAPRFGFKIAALQEMT